MSDTTTETTETKPEVAPKWATDLHAAMKEVGTGIGQIATLLQQPAQRAEPVVEPAEITSVTDENNIEIIPRKELVRKLEESFEARLEAALKPLQEQIEQTKNNVVIADYKGEAQAFAARTPQMGEWEKEMMTIAEKNPQMSIPDIYFLARGRDPAKAAEMDKKYAAGEPPKPAKPETKKPPLAMSPASGAAEVTNQRMSQEEASRDAWEKAVAKFGNPFS